MHREATLFESSNGSIISAYLMLKKQGGNIPPNWIDRASESRMKLHKDIAKILRTNALTGYEKLKEFEIKYEKECFYYGLRVLLELERYGKSEL